MIIDLRKFAAQEQPYWRELDQMLDSFNLLARKNRRKLSKWHKRKAQGDDSLQDEMKDAGYGIETVRRFHYLYERTSSDLAKLNTFASEPELKQYLENLVSRAYCVIHANRERQRFRPLEWVIRTVPDTFRRHARAFLLSTALTMLGVLFGAVALVVDSRAKEVLVPTGMGYTTDPMERVKAEESQSNYKGGGAAGHAWYFAHNTKISLLTMALGLTFGIGTSIVLFSNGIILGAIGIDYMNAGFSKFLFAWLLPHGSVEIPAILIAGQAGLVLANAMIGWGQRKSLRQRMREIRPDVVTLSVLVAFMMGWAGFIESHFSQNHEPFLPYWVKISVGIIQLTLLIWYFGFCGKRKAEDQHA